MVFVLRHVEELSTAETAELLELTEEAVKTRLHRACAALQKALLAKAGGDRPSLDLGRRSTEGPVLLRIRRRELRSGPPGLLKLRTVKP